MNVLKSQKDERALAVENASYSVVYKVMSFALLLDVMYRSFFRGEAPWDLIGIVVLGGIVGAVYQARQRTLTRNWAKAVWLSAIAALIVAAVIALVR
jgi:hypothetical protein